MSPSEAYARFAEVLASLDGSAGRYRELVAPYEADYEQRLWRRFRREFPSKSFTVGKAGKWLRSLPPVDGVTQDERLRRQVRSEAAPAIAAWKAERDALVLELVRLAPDVPLDPKPTYHVLEVWGVAEFHTQGMGAARYARVRGELSLRLAITRGVPGASLNERAGDIWEVSVPLDSVQVEALKRRTDGMTLAEMVRFAWKEGCNPRVFWPLLPPDFEERHGFDYFGRDRPFAPPSSREESSEEGVKR